MGKVIVTGTGISAGVPVDFSFGDYPELGFALPFANMSFERWDATLPEGWAQTHSPGTGTRAKYNPGFDSTRALKIYDTGVIVTPENGVKQTIVLPTHILNGQKIRVGAAIANSLGGAYGDSKAAIAVEQNTGSYKVVNYLYPAVSSDWQLFIKESDPDINTSYTDLILRLLVASFESSSAPAALFDCVFAQYGRTIAESSYVFERKPEFSGLDATADTFAQSERTGIAKLRTWDPTGGAVKWKFVLPFVNIPGAMYEALYEFFRINKGLDDKEGVHLVLHHKLIDINDTYNLHMPPWIVCDIAESTWPLKPSGGWLGAKFYSGTLTFQEV